MDGVSLIICCHNSASKLPQTLKHVNELKVSSDIPWELIIIDNASTDSTFEIAAQLLSAGIKSITKIVTEKKLGLTNARLRGIAESQYNYCSFIDDDNWICSNWINVVHEIMTDHPEVGACGGLGLPSFESTPPLWFDQFKQSYAVGPQGEMTGYVPDSRGYLWGAGLTIRKSAWDELINNGFILTLTGRHGTNLTSGEDSEICLALRCNNWRLWYDERLIYYHYLPAFRFDRGYLKKLCRGMGTSDVILGIYREYINSTIIISPDFHNVWLVDLYKIIKKRIMQPIDIKRTDKISRIGMGLHAQFGKLWEIIKLRNRYDELKRQIFTFYQHSKHYQGKLEANYLIKSNTPTISQSINNQEP